MSARAVRRSAEAARLVPPPRRVPFTLRVRLLFGGWGAFAWGFLTLAGGFATLFLRVVAASGSALPAPAAALVVLFPAAGVALVALWTWYVWRPLRLLARGKTAMATRVGSEATRLEVSGPDGRGGTVVRMRFAFRADDGASVEATVRAYASRRLEDDDRELLLYDPARPERAVAWDVLEGRPRVDAAGALKPAGTRWEAFRLLTLPAGALALPPLILYLERALAALFL